MSLRLILTGAALCAGAAALAQVAPQPAPAGRAVPLPVIGNKAHAAKAGPADGRSLFHEKCAMCHGPVGMGTGLLARRMDPAIAELEKRDDLTPDYIQAAVRGGIGNMPWMARGEVSDPQLAAIAAYLSKQKKP
ncbi:MAG: hypothetical protein JWN59_980 [Sphingomonas bacterium]|nr:hypothetical protein [Sphingomonas bacterium]